MRLIGRVVITIEAMGEIKTKVGLDFQSIGNVSAAIGIRRWIMVWRNRV